MEHPNPAPAAFAALPRTQPLVAPRAIRLLCLLALVGLALWLGRHSWLQVQEEGPDFEYFYKGGAALLAHGTYDPGYDIIDGHVQRRGSLEWYLPCVARVMTLLAWLPLKTAGAVWLVLRLAALFATLRLLGRHLSGLPPQDWPVTQLVPVLMLLPFWWWESRLNQINGFTLLLLVASYVHWEQGRRNVAGFWLGLAVLLKLTPAVLVLWFGLKRQYRTVGVALLTIVLAGPVADLVAFRPDLTIDSYKTWVTEAVTNGSHRGLIESQREMDWRNQGLGAVLSRWLSPTNYNTHFDNDPRHQAEHGLPGTKMFNVVTLPRPTVALIVNGVAGITLLALVWLTRRSAGRLTRWQLRLEWALWVLAMLWFMPVMRRYHMIWLLPTLTVLGAAMHYARLRSRWTKFTLACLAVAWLAQLSMLSMRAEASGILLASVVILALPVVALLLRLARDPTALPAPAYDGGTGGVTCVNEPPQTGSGPETVPNHA